MTKARITKKLVALATTMMMLAAMVMPAVAAPQGTITVHKYAGTSMLGAVGNTTGEQLTGTDLTAITAAGYTPLEHAEFTLYHLPQTDIDAVNAAITDTNLVEGHVIDISGAFPEVVFTMTDATTHTASATAVYGTPQTTDVAGEAVFGSGDIPDGYYVLVETSTPAGYQSASPSLIRLPLTKADGTFNYDVHVYPKNVSSEGIAVKSIVGLDTPVAFGDVLDFELKGKFISGSVTTAADLRDGTTYGLAEIQDNFDLTFEYVPNSLEVFWLDAAGELTGTALPPTFYDITTDTATGSPGGDLIVELTELGIDAAITGSHPGFGLALKAEYVGAPGALPKNSMQLSVIAAHAPVIPPIIVEIYAPSLKITIDKTTSDATGNLPLPGVVFAVAKEPIPAINYVPGTPASAFSAAELTQLENDYVVDATGVPITGVTDANGEVVLEGLDGYANAELSFYVKELETVAGYQLKLETVEVKFASQADYKLSNPGWFDGTDWLANVVINENVTIRNYEIDEEDVESPGFSLPLTGGAGTLVFTAVGILVMCAAVVVYLKGKKQA